MVYPNQSYHLVKLAIGFNCLFKQVIKNKDLRANGISMLAKTFLEILQSNDNQSDQPLDLSLSNLTVGDYESLLDMHEYNQISSHTTSNQKCYLPTATNDSMPNPQHKKMKRKMQCDVSNLSGTKGDDFFNRLRTTCIYRAGLISRLFTTEFTGYPEAISSNGKMYRAAKSDFLKIPLIRYGEIRSQNLDSSMKSGIVFNISAMINALRSAAIGKSFQQLSEQLFQVILNLGANYHRLDIVCDSYFQSSFNSSTRPSFTADQSLPFNPDSIIPKDFTTNFLRLDRNEKALNNFFMEQIVNFDFDSKSVYFSNDSRVIHYDGLSRKWFLSEDTYLNHGCRQEKADTKVVLHVSHMVKNNVKNITVKTVDTDVVMLLVSSMPEFVSYKANITVDYNFGKSRRLYCVNTIAKSIGYNNCLGLPFFYAFTGCDSTSSFLHYSKQYFFDLWLGKFPELTSVFSELSCMPESVPDSLIADCEQFVIDTYDPHSKFKCRDINKLRLELFTSSATNDLSCLPPTFDALKLHIMRAAYQAGWIWGSCLKPNLDLPSSTLWGWHQNKTFLTPTWITVPIMNYNDVFLSCSCIQSDCLTCVCRKTQLSCLPFCKCYQKCSNYAMAEYSDSVI